MSTSSIAVTGVQSCGRFTDRVGSDSWISIYGRNFASDTRAWSADDFLDGSLPTKLGDVSVTINGQPAYIAYVSPNQINLLSPIDTSNSPELKGVITVGSVQSNSFSINWRGFAPGFFFVAFRRRALRSSGAARRSVRWQARSTRPRRFHAPHQTGRSGNHLSYRSRTRNPGFQTRDNLAPGF